jgi:hypothetical protein
MNRFVTWARFANKSKEQLQPPNVLPDTTPPLPEGGQEKEGAEEAADPPPCRDSLDHRSADLGQPDDTHGEDMVTPKAGAVIEPYVAVPLLPQSPQLLFPHTTDTPSSYLSYAQSSSHPTLISLCAFQVGI